jgi:hypothetical protein
MVEGGTRRARADVNADHDPILTVEELLRFPHQLFEGAPVLLGKSDHFFATPTNPRITGDVVVGEREFRVGIAKQRIPVPAVERLIDGSHDFYVLLRHRLLRQPGSNPVSAVSE